MGTCGKPRKRESQAAGIQRLRSRSHTTQQTRSSNRARRGTRYSRTAEKGFYTPSKAQRRCYTDAAGLDLYASQDIEIKAHTRAAVPTGISIKLPFTTLGRISSRSSLALKGIDVTAGVIDANYRGEIRVILVNNSDLAFKVNKGDRIAQLIVERIAMTDIEIVDDLTPSTRGTGGFGSTGV